MLQPNNSKSGNGRGRFLLGRSASSQRNKTQKSINKNFRVSFRKSSRSVPVLSPLKEITPSSFRPSPEQRYYSKSPIATQETVDATGFSKAELYELEESFKLFDVYSEGIIQVGDLKGILGVLQQEEQEATKYSNLNLLLDRLSELSDEDTLDLETYIRLMASITIGNSIAVGDNNQDEHFSRVFALFDTDGKGYITLKDMETIAIELGEHDMTRGELQEMIDRAIGDTSNENLAEKRVGIEDFTRMMTMSLFPSNEQQ